MEQFTIHFFQDAGNGLCALCGEVALSETGPGLSLVDREARICRGCGQRHTPQLVALLDLAQAAQRIGRVGRHILIPPMEALLDLARAAENYSTLAPQPLQRAA